MPPIARRYAGTTSSPSTADSSDSGAADDDSDDPLDVIEKRPPPSSAASRRVTHRVPDTRANESDSESGIGSSDDDIASDEVVPTPTRLPVQPVIHRSRPGGNGSKRRRISSDDDGDADEAKDNLVVELRKLQSVRRTGAVSDEEVISPLRNRRKPSRVVLSDEDADDGVGAPGSQIGGGAQIDNNSDDEVVGRGLEQAESADVELSPGVYTGIRLGPSMSGYDSSRFDPLGDEEEEEAREDDPERTDRPELETLVPPQFGSSEVEMPVVDETGVAALTDIDLSDVKPQTRYNPVRPLTPDIPMEKEDENTIAPASLEAIIATPTAEAKSTGIENDRPTVPEDIETEAQGDSADAPEAVEATVPDTTINKESVKTPSPAPKPSSDVTQETAESETTGPLDEAGEVPTDPIQQSNHISTTEAPVTAEKDMKGTASTTEADVSVAPKQDTNESTPVVTAAKLVPAIVEAQVPYNVDDPSTDGPGLPSVDVDANKEEGDASQAEAQIETVVSAPDASISAEPDLVLTDASGPPLVPADADHEMDGVEGEEEIEADTDADVGEDEATEPDPTSNEAQPPAGAVPDTPQSIPIAYAKSSLEVNPKSTAPTSKKEKSNSGSAAPASSKEVKEKKEGKSKNGTGKVGKEKDKPIGKDKDKDKDKEEGEKAEKVEKGEKSGKSGKGKGGKKGKVENLKANARASSVGESSSSRTPERTSSPTPSQHAYHNLTPSKRQAIEAARAVAGAEAAGAEDGEEDDDDDDDDQVYCVCGKVNRDDGNDDLVACDSCDHWFHAGCVNLRAKDIERIDSFICQSCEKLTVQRTTFFRACARATCEKMFAKRQSKYCSSACGIKHARSLLSSLPPSTIPEIRSSLSHFPSPPPEIRIIEHCSISDTTVPPRSTPSDVLLQLETEMGAVRGALGVLEKRGKLISSLIETCETLPPISANGRSAAEDDAATAAATKSSSKNKKKGSTGKGGQVDDRPCGWRGVVQWVDEEVGMWDGEIRAPMPRVEGEEGQEGGMDLDAPGDNVEDVSTELDVWAWCERPRKRCDRHSGWQKTSVMLIEGEMDDLTSRLAMLESQRDLMISTEQVKAKERQAREELYEKLASHVARKLS